MMFLTIWYIFFKIPKIIGKHYSNDSLKKNSYRLGHNEITNQNCFQFDQRSSYVILWKQGKIFLVKTLMGIHWSEVDSPPIFSSSWESIESWSKLPINQIASSLVMSNNCDLSKSLIGTFDFVLSTPLF